MMKPDQTDLELTELVDARPSILVPEVEYKRLLGYPFDFVLEGRARELADHARLWYAEHGRPWIYARPAGNFEIADGRLHVNGTGFNSKQLYELLSDAQAHAAMLVAVSAGKECEEEAHRLWEEGKPDEYFFLEMYGSAVVEHLITSAGGRICAQAEPNRMAVLPHYSPGYSGWDVSDQVRLWELIRPKNGRPLPGEIEVMNTGMLRPKKSLLALFGVTRRLDRLQNHAGLVPCENCSLSACAYRRKPYQHARPQIEDVRRLQPGQSAPGGAKIIPLSVLNHNAQYSLNPRALQKWSEERLELKFGPDDCVDALFRYEGTTCSNLGRALEFDYYVKLGPLDGGYKILETICLPAPDDDGYMYQCEYISDPETLMNRIAREKPLLGRPLNDVLTWERAYSPSGCFCDSERRAHKWGLVLEVIHFTLVQHEKKMLRREPPAEIAENNGNPL
jgi:hypothetical protein